MLTTENINALTAPFAYEDHEFLETYPYITEEAITRRIETVDAGWAFEVVETVIREDATIITAKLTICGTTRTSNGAGVIQRVGRNGDLTPYAVAENIGNSHKGALTDALKRCSRLFGIGRYILGAPKLMTQNDKKTLTSQSEKAFRDFLGQLGIPNDAPKMSGTIITPPPAAVSTSGSTVFDDLAAEDIEFKATTLESKVNTSGKRFYKLSDEHGAWASTFSSSDFKEYLSDAELEAIKSNDASIPVQLHVAAKPKKSGTAVFYNVISIKPVEIPF